MADDHQIESKLDELFGLYNKWGHQNYIGEAVTQLQHAQQASQLAATAGYNEEVVFGAFVHDIGHVIGLEKNLPEMEQNGILLGTVDHDLVGEKFLLDLGFSINVTQFVRGHVQAKRYLVWKDPGYHAKLSEASKGTLVCQGGSMSEKEALAFEKQETFQAVLEMRRWDEEAKDPNIQATDNNNLRTIARKLK